MRSCFVAKVIQISKQRTRVSPHDKNIVFTYKTVFNKVDSTNKALAGADFTLYKKVNGSWTDVTPLGSGENKPYKTISDATNGTKNSVFTFTGLDDGEYKLSETTTPNGYNTMDDIFFTITAEHETESDNPTLTSLKGTQVKEDGTAWTGSATFTATSDTATGSLTSDITNYKGSELPTTGGIGTTIFYILGAILVAGAAVVLVARKRSEN